jgi:hypothetical protein
MKSPTLHNKFKKNKHIFVIFISGWIINEHVNTKVKTPTNRCLMIPAKGKSKDERERTKM